MNVKKKLIKLWPTYLGEFHNPAHNIIKDVWPNFITHGSYPYTGKKNRVIVSANTTVSLLENNKPVPSN